MKKTTTKTLGLILVIVAVVGFIIVVLLYLMHGNIVTTNNEITSISSRLLSCVSDEVPYPVFTYDNSDKKELKVDLIFAGDRLKTIALNYTLYYGSKEAIMSSEAVNHADMNLSFYGNGLGSDALNAKYTKLSDGLRFSLYAHGVDVNAAIARYFMLSRIDDNDDLPNIMEWYQKKYEEQGLVCVTSE